MARVRSCNGLYVCSYHIINPQNPRYPPRSKLRNYLAQRGIDEIVSSAGIAALPCANCEQGCRATPVCRARAAAAPQ